MHFVDASRPRRFIGNTVCNLLNLVRPCGIHQRKNGLREVTGFPLFFRRSWTPAVWDGDAIHGNTAAV